MYFLANITFELMKAKQCRRRNININIFIVLFAFVNLLMPNVNAQFGQPIIYSISTNIDKVVSAQGSILGGTTVYIRGINFSYDSSFNTITLGTYPCNPSSDGSTDILLVCITTPATDPTKLFGLPTSVSVFNGGTATCGWCYFSYMISATPFLQQISPRTALGNQIIQIWGLHRITDPGDGRSPDVGQIKSILINDNTCSILDVIQQDQISPNSRDQLYCTTYKNQIAGEYSFTQTVSGGIMLNSLRTYQTSIFTKANYTQRISAQIFSMPYHLGGSLGHNIRLTGTGFALNLDNFTCEVAGQQCQVSNAETSSITVSIPPKSISNTNFGALPKDSSDLNVQEGVYLGTNGFRYTQYDLEGMTKTLQDWYSYIQNSNLNNLTVLQDKYVTQIGSTQGNSTIYSYAQYWRGYFVAPVSGIYRFAGLANDAFIMKFSQVQNSSNIANLKTLIYQNQISDSHFLPYLTGQPSETNVTLNQGYYYMQVVSLNFKGTGFFKLMVDIPQIGNIINPTWQVDKVNIAQNKLIPEIITVTVNNTLLVANSITKFDLTYKSVSGGVVSNSFCIFSLGDSANTFANKLSNSNLTILTNYNTTVTLQTITNTTTSAVITYIYTITIISYRSSNPLPISAVTGIKIARTQSHSPPITGTFNLKIGNDLLSIYDSNLKVYYTNISYNAPMGAIADALNLYYTTTQISVSWQQGISSSDNISFFIEYVGVHGVPKLITVQTPLLYGGSDNIFKDISYTVRWYSKRPLYNPIPYEFLRTAQTNPQLYLTTNKIPIFCSDCSYSYNSSRNAIVQSAVLSGTSYTLSVSDSGNAGFGLSDIAVYLSEAKIQCTTLTGSLSNFACNFKANSQGNPALPAGSSIPQVHIANIGYADVSALSSVSVPLTAVQSMTPSATGINGGISGTVIGTGFPIDDNAIFSVVLCNNTVTEYTTVSNQKIVFIIPQAVIGCDSTTISQISFSGQTASLTFNYDNSVTPQILSLSIQSASPILKGQITITGDKFTILQNTKVFLIQSGVKIYQLGILTFSTTEIRCVLGGGKTGTYHVQVFDSTTGASAINPISSFNYQIIVNSISPSSGGLGGGYNITISGVNFAASDSMTVFIGDAINAICNILSATSTTIVCIVPRMDKTYVPGTPVKVVVAGRILQESLCHNNCNFTYDDNPTVTNYIIVPSQLTYSAGDIVTINGDTVKGTNLTGAIVSVDGIPVSLNSSTSTSLSFIYPALIAGNDYQILITTLVGYNYPSIITNTKTWFANGVSRSSGSTNGHLLSVAGNGLASSVSDPLLSVYSVCPKTTTQLKILAAVPNRITFQMIPMAADSYCGLNVTYGSKNIMFGYTYNSSLTTAVSISENAGIYTATKTNSTNMVVDFVNFLFLDSQGNPTTTIYPVTPNSSYSTVFTLAPTGGYLPKGKFMIKIHAKLLGYSVVTPSIFTNPWTNSPTASPVISSFVGGQTLLISGSGFITVSPQNNHISVCGIRALVKSATASQIILTLPPLVTRNTQALYNLAKSSIISGLLISDTPQNAPFAIDGLIKTFYHSSNNQCYIGLNFGSNAYANISTIKYMPNPNWAIAANYLKGAVFQGSNDSVTWTTIFQVDTTQVHSGRNLWIASSLIQYQFIRFSHNSLSQCELSDFVVEGIIYSTVPIVNGVDKQCDVIIKAPVNDITLSNIVTYSHAKTSIITSIQPAFASSAGGDVLTLTGNNFGSSITVNIDGVNCIINSQTATQIRCLTGYRAKAPEQGNTFTVYSDGNKVLVTIQPFLYIDRWSTQATWGGQALPRDGDSVYVPVGMTLLVDVASTPMLDSIIVQGKIKFSDEMDMTLDTKYFIINKGSFQAGTLQKRYQHKLTLTLHGGYYAKQLPIFGNKVLGCLNCKFSLHGKERRPTWTMVANTINIGDTSFNVLEPVDWQPGQQIVIAATSFDHYQSQQMTIVSVSADNLTITVAQPFKFRHYSAIQNHAGTDFVMRAEVGLLTRNILIRGDQNSISDRYGSHLMISGKRDKGLIASISYTQFTQCGQPKIIGRYCTHFHMTGQMPQSSVTGVSVHHSYARFLTIHGTHFLTVQKNVGYHIEGHNIFLEDGIQTNNVIQDNLMITSITSLTLLQSDISVASYWITNPSNYFRRNHAAGGDFYGIWYEVKPHPDGPSATNGVCPMGMPLSQSRDNVAHSNSRFGLRIFKLASMKFPCNPPFDEGLINPFTGNIAIQSVFDNFTLWSNQQCGFLGQELGYTTLNNFKTIDSQKGGLQFHKTNITKQLVKAQNSVIVGFSSGNAHANIDSYYKNGRGVIASRTDGLLVSNVTFVNFGPTMTPLQSCSQCWNVKLWVDGAKTTYFNQIAYVNVTGNYVYWEKWRRQIFIDMDGTLLAPLVNTFLPSIGSQNYGTVTPYIPSLMVPTHCHNITGPLWDSSIYCDKTINLRSILFTNAIPFLDFQSIDIKVYLLSDPYDNLTLINPSDQKFTDQYQIVIKPLSKDIPFSWAMAFAVNRTYNVHWKLGIDFTHMAIAPSGQWNQTEGVVLRFNYTDERQLYQIGKLYKRIVQQPYVSEIKTLISPQTCLNGDFYHDRNSKYLFVCVSGRNKTERQWIDVNGIRCLNFCPTQNQSLDKQSFSRLWSNRTQWPGQILPAAGNNVTIPYEWNLVLDIDPPVLNYVNIQGNLIFDRSRDNKFQAHYIWVSQGNMTIGSADSPFTKKATIVLHGEKDDNYLVIDQNASGNKMLVNTGGLQFYGNPPAKVWTKLTAIAKIGDTFITVLDDITSWNIGDQIVIAPSYSGQKEFQQVTITGISGKNITFTPALVFQHYGDNGITISNNYGVLDARSAVGLLTRNIRITNASDAHGWGCRVLNYGYLQLPSDLINGQVQLRNGYLKWNGVQLDGCGQYDTSYAGLRIQHIGFHSPSQLSPSMRAIYNGYPRTQINSSSIHACYGMCTWIADSKNITFNNNVFFWARKFLVYVEKVDQYNFTNNLLIGARKRDQLIQILETTDMVDDICAYQQYSRIDFINGQVNVSNNLVQGSQGQGFVFPFTTCDKIQTYNFANNSAGSCSVGVMYDKLDGKTCLAASNFVGYACNIGLMANPPGSHQKILYKNFFFADNFRGITLRYANQIDDNTIDLQDSYFIGVSRPNCVNCYSADKLSYCLGGYAVRMFSGTISGQNFPLIKKAEGFDVICTQEAFDFKSFFNNVTFENYFYNNPSLSYCTGMSVFKRHAAASDGVGSAYLTNCPCINCQSTALAFFEQPNPAWLGWFGGCGQIQCTGPNNYFIYDQDGSFTGSPSQLLANNSMIGDYESACTLIPEINGYHCALTDLAVLQYESIAPDYNKRMVWPIFLFYDGGNWTSTTNGWKQWSWNGKQPMNTRLARFWSVLRLKKTYNVTYSSQPPSDSRYQIQKRLQPTGNPNDWAIIRVYYPLPNSIQVLVKNTTGVDIIVPPFPIIQNVSENLTQHINVCGANTFHYKNGTIEFVVNGINNCQVRVRVSSYIQLSARINIPIADFYSNNGVTTFITNICAFLGIDTGRLKIVGVRSGSMIVQAVIQTTAQPLNTSTTGALPSPQTLSNLQTLANQAVSGIQSGSINLGAPVIEVSSSIVVLNPDGSVYTTQDSSVTSSQMLIIILATLIPVVVIIIVVGVIFYFKRKRQRVSSIDSQSQVQFYSNQLKDAKRSSIKVSQVPFQISKMEDTWYHPN